MKNHLCKKLLSLSLALTVAAGAVGFTALSANAQTASPAAVSSVQKFTNTSVISAEEITLGSYITVNASAEGGSGNYTYSVLYKKHNLTKWTVKQDFKTNAKVKIKPGKATDYDICVKAKDGRGIISKKYFTVKVSEKLQNYSVLSRTKVAAGEPITVYTSGAGGIGAYKYAAYYKQTTETTWTTARKYSAETSFSFALSKIADYEVCVKIKDEAGNIAKKYFTVSVQDYVQDVIKLVNEERAKVDAPALTVDETLCKAAAKRAVELTTKFDHERPDGSLCFTVMDEFGLIYWGAGENIAAGQSTPQSVMNSWMNSPGHKANILDESFTHIGVAVYIYNGTKYWVQLFATF